MSKRDIRTRVRSDLRAGLTLLEILLSSVFEYPKNVQVTSNTPGNQGATGWFLQKTRVDGTLEWYRVQLDQTAMPIMLGWKLWRAGVFSNTEIKNMEGSKDRDYSTIISSIKPYSPDLFAFVLKRK